MLGLTELEFKCIKDAIHRKDYRGYDYSIYKLEGPIKSISISRGVIELKDEDIFSLYKLYPLKVDKVNDMLTYYDTKRPCIISELVCVDGKHYERKNIRYTVTPHPKYLQINMYDETYNEDMYLLEVAVRDVIEYLNILEKVNKNER